MKGSVLELGGKDPQIVCADANLPHADLGRRLGRVRERGPDVLGDRADLRGARRRGPVHRRRRARGERADGRRPARVDDRDRADGLRRSSSTSSCELVDDAVAAGATAPVRRAARGRRASRGHFIAPTVLTGVTHDMRIMREEIFGPVLPIITVDSEQEAIDLANDSRVRPRRLGLDARPRQGRAHGAPDPVRHGLDQRPLLLPRRLPVLVGRRQGVGPRPLALQVRLLRVREHQAAVAGSHRACATSGGTRTTRCSARRSAPRRGMLYGRDGQRAARRLREGALPLLRVTGRSLRRGRWRLGRSPTLSSSRSVRRAIHSTVRDALAPQPSRNVTLRLKTRGAAAFGARRQCLCRTSAPGSQ